MTTFGGSILANFWLHEDEKILLYFSECSSKVSLGQIILNALVIDDFLQTVNVGKTHAFLIVRYNYSVSLLHISY